jgi:hypothetical protein
MQPAASLFHVAHHPHPSFRTEQADFFFPFCSCKTVGLRREKSLFSSISPADLDEDLIHHINAKKKFCANDVIW